VSQRKTRGRVDRYSLLVGILPPLLHTGLARRTEIACSRQSSQGQGGAGQGRNKERWQPDYSGKAIFFRSSM